MGFAAPGVGEGDAVARAPAAAQGARRLARLRLSRLTVLGPSLKLFLRRIYNLI